MRSCRPVLSRPQLWHCRELGKARELGPRYPRASPPFSALPPPPHHRRLWLPAHLVGFFQVCHDQADLICPETQKESDPETAWTSAPQCGPWRLRSTLPTREKTDWVEKNPDCWELGTRPQNSS